MQVHIDCLKRDIPARLSETMDDTAKGVSASQIFLTKIVFSYFLKDIFHYFPVFLSI